MHHNIMNVSTLQVLVSKATEKISKAGKPFKFLTLQGLATLDDGTQSMFTYDFWPERDQPLPVIPPGSYAPIYGCRVHWERNTLEPSFVGFKPLKAS